MNIYEAAKAIREGLAKGVAAAATVEAIADQLSEGDLEFFRKYGEVAALAQQAVTV